MEKRTKSPVLVNGTSLPAPLLKLAQEPTWKISTNRSFCQNSVSLNKACHIAAYT